MPSTSTPVAIGSRVPAWPTLRVPQMRRARPTTSWLVQPCGLSTTSRPSGAGIRAVAPLAHGLVVVLVEVLVEVVVEVVVVECVLVPLVRVGVAGVRRPGRGGRHGGV